MKDYRVTYISENGNRTHRDYKTEKGARKFAEFIGTELCIITKYNPATFCYEEI